ncbi:DUF2493 domain-containing protein [Methylobacterium sp. Leaf108]|uniref:DUF2493 domain-containing protein n=1 Tax=Methylobacterium sp. Leaf108 TaxID=1736256 RepID=UPI0006FD3C49|nr:DUF2493 domain-containing protein [Methylobacterium sp. Leaf108]KQP61039.1 hypothetical protein ASF39_15295 [Methylobacterium sp. Leaf108]
MRVLVCGGRDYRDKAHVFATLDRLAAEPGIDWVIQGGATGADQMAREWCHIRRIGYLNFPADWKQHGRAAGPLRNATMIAEGRPDLVLAFPGGRGTADMTRKAEAAGINVVRVAPFVSETQP